LSDKEDSSAQDVALQVAYGPAGSLRFIGYINRSDRMIRLITSKDHTDSSSRSNPSSLNLSRLDGSGEQALFSQNEIAPISRTGKLSNSHRPFIVEVAPISRTGKLSNTDRTFIISRADIIKRLMSPLTMVEDLNVAEDGTPGFIPSLERAVMDELILQ